MNIMRSVSTVCQYGMPILTFSSNLLVYVIVLPVYHACVACFRILMHVRVPCPWAPESRSLKFLFCYRSLHFCFCDSSGDFVAGAGDCEMAEVFSGVKSASFIFVLNPWSVSQRDVPIILKRPAFHSGLRPSGLISWKLARSLGTFSVLR